MLKIIAKFQHNKPSVLPDKAPNSRLKPYPTLTSRRGDRNAALTVHQDKGRWGHYERTEQGNSLATLHYTSGNNIDSQGNFTPAQAGFNLADVSSVDELNSLPDGVKGLVWLDQHDGVNQSFIDAVTPYIGNPNVYGFFLAD